MRTRLVVFVGFAVLVGACADTGTDTTTTVGADPSTSLTTAAPTTTVAVTTTSIVRLPTADEIMADGEVTDEEREVARQAVFECLVDVGADTTFELFDIDPVVQRDYPDEYQDCLWKYTGIYRRNEFPDDRFNLGLLGVVECTEDRTGEFYGPKTVDEIGRLTDLSRETIFEAINQDEKAYEECLEFVRGFDSIAWFRSEDGQVVRIYDDNTLWGSFVEYRFDDNDPKRISLSGSPNAATATTLGSSRRPTPL
jgi:hypothetical protein